MKFIQKILMSSLLLSTAVGLSGCSSDPTVTYTDPGAVQTTSLDYSSTDLQTVTNGLVNDMLTSPVLAKNLAKEATTPVLFVGSLQNNSSQQIDTQQLTNAISTRLINSGKFNFVDMSQVKAVEQQLHYQHQSGMVDPGTAVAIGKQTGAQYMLYGDISSINQRNSNMQTLYLQVTLKLMDLRSGLIVWQNEKQISKEAKRKTFGW